MLVLSRYRDESIYIGDEIIVTIVDIRGDRVRLGIQAPSNIPVHRKEIYDVILRGKKEIIAPAKSEESDIPKKKKFTAPLEKKLESRKNKGLLVEIHNGSFGFGEGLEDLDVVPQ